MPYNKAKVAAAVRGQLQVLGGNEHLTTFLTQGQLPLPEGSEDTERYGMSRMTRHEIDGVPVNVATFVETVIKKATEPPPQPENQGAGVGVPDA